MTKEEQRELLQQRMKFKEPAEKIMGRIAEDLKAAYPRQGIKEGRLYGPYGVPIQHCLSIWGLDVLAVDLREIENWLMAGLSWEAIRLLVFQRLRQTMLDNIDRYLKQLMPVLPA